MSDFNTNGEMNIEQENAQTETPHKRRKRYSGTHPRKFEEKYKERLCEK